MKINRIKFLSAVILGVLFSCGTAFAVNVSTNIPGVTAAGNPGQYVNAFYKFSLLISGVLAFGAIVYGGVKYTLAAGNPSGQSEGKEWVKGALTGLLLLVGAYTILNIINPNLTKLALPGLTPLQANNITPSGGPSGGPSTNANQTYGCIAGDDTYACSSSGTKSDCSDANGCSGRACFQLATALCGQVSGLNYACLGATDQKYACSPTYRSDCSDSTGCGSPSTCTQIPSNCCGQVKGSTGC